MWCRLRLKNTEEVRAPKPHNVGWGELQTPKKPKKCPRGREFYKEWNRPNTDNLGGRGKDCDLTL